MFSQLWLSHLLRNCHYLPTILLLHLTSTYVLSLHLLLSPQHHPVLSQTLFYILFYNFLFPSYHPNIFDATSTKNFQQPFARHIFSATTHFIQKLENIPHQHIYFQSPTSYHTINCLVYIVHKTQRSIIQHILDPKQNCRKFHKQQSFTSNQLFQTLFYHSN